MPSSRSASLRSKAGLTLLDVVIATLIVGILAAIAAPRFAGSISRLKAEAAAQRVQMDLELIRERSLSDSASYTVVFTPASNSYAIAGFPHPDHPNSDYSVQLSESPYEATIYAVSLGGGSSITFDRFGVPDTGGTITVESGGHQVELSVDAETGRATFP